MNETEQTLPDPPPDRPKTHPSYLAILRRRWWLILLLMLSAIAVTLIGSLNRPALFRSSLRLQVFVLDAQEVTLYTRLSTSGAADQIFLTQNNFSDVLNSSLIAWRTINDLDLDISARELLEHITVSVSGEFVSVSYEAETPEKAHDILTRQVENALSHYTSLQARPVIATGQFIQAELDAQNQTFTAAQDDLLRFKLEHNVGDLQREINAVQDELRGLEAGRNAALVEAVRSETLAAEWERLALKAEVDLDAARQQLSTLTAAQPAPDSPPTPEIEALTGQIAALDATARSQRATARNQAANATAQQAVAARQESIISQRSADLSQLISLSSEYNGLVAAVQSAQADADFLRSKAVEARLKERQVTDVGSLQIVEPAFLPGAPAPSATLRLLLLAGLISLLAGLVISLLLEFISPTPAFRPQSP